MWWFVNFWERKFHLVESVNLIHQQTSFLFLLYFIFLRILFLLSLALWCLFLLFMLDFKADGSRAGCRNRFLQVSEISRAPSSCWTLPVGCCCHALPSHPHGLEEACETSQSVGFYQIKHILFIHGHLLHSSSLAKLVLYSYLLVVKPWWQCSVVFLG